MIIHCPSCSAKNRVPAARLGEGPKCGSCKQALPPPAAPVSIKEAELPIIVESAPWPVLVDVWAPWCGPCRTVAPELDKLARARQGELLVVKLNADQAQSTLARLGIRGIPTMLVYEGGREKNRATGAMSARDIEARLLA